MDTPGFNDTEKSDTEILMELAQWLEVTYKNNCKLNGIIYLHRISDVRMDGAGMRNLKVFRKLCGDDPLKNVVITSTFWGCIADEKAVQNENELCSDPEFWGEMIENGAQVARFTGDQQSGWDVIMAFAKKIPVILELQRELVVEGKPFEKTAVAQVVSADLAALELKYKADIEKIQKETAEALAEKDAKLEQSLKNAQKRMQRKLYKVKEEQEMIRAEKRSETRRMEREYEQRHRVMKMENEKQLEQLEKLRSDEVRARATLEEKFEREKTEMEKARADDARQRAALEDKISRLTLNSPASTQSPQESDDDDDFLAAMAFRTFMKSLLIIIDSI